MPNKKAIVLLSGGIDSATAAYKMKAEGYDIIALTLLYGQVASREVECAKKIAEAVQAERHVILDLNVLKKIFISPLTVDNPRDVVKPQENDREGSSYYLVPLRNLVFMSIACAFAESVQAEAVVIGAHGDDCKGFPDCRPEFYVSLFDTVKKGTEDGGMVPRILQPWAAHSKAEIIAEGLKFGVPYEHTHSCYLNSDHPCGICESCQYRIQAFLDNGTGDPLMFLYINAPDVVKK